MWETIRHDIIVRCVFVHVYYVLYVCVLQAKQPLSPQHSHWYTANVSSHFSFSNLHHFFLFPPSPSHARSIVSIICLAIKLQGTLLKKDINSGLPMRQWCPSLRWDMSELPWVTLTGERRDVRSRQQAWRSTSCSNHTKIRNIKANPSNQKCA